jgi:ABC-2 type transport system permease protein
MTALSAALWGEWLKVRRSLVSVLTAAGLMILPLIAGLFMIILRDPEGARSMGLISAKAQLAAGSADWPAYFGILTQGMAIGGGFVFAIFVAWIFGREFMDRTAKELLAVPTPRTTIVGAKLLVVLLWVLMVTLAIYVAGLVVGLALNLPGWSLELGLSSFGIMMGIGLLTALLLTWAAFFASLGRGYLPPLGWTFVTVVLAQITAVLGWGDWFPWAVPALLSGMAGSPGDLMGWHSLMLVLVTGASGLAATLLWWRGADQTR